MATVIAVPTFELSAAEKKAMIATVPKAVCDAFCLNINITGLMIQKPIEPDCMSESAKNHITYFVYTAPNKTDDQKRAMIKGVYDATIAALENKETKIVVIIKEHADNNVGVAGEMRVDAKKNGTYRV